MSHVSAGTSPTGPIRWRLPRAIINLAKGPRPSGPQRGGGGDVGDRLEDILGEIGRNKPSLSWQIPLVIVLLVGMVAFRPYVVIPNGEAGVVFSAVSGVKPEPLSPGFHVVVPLLHKVTLYDTKQRTSIMSSQVDQGDVRGDDALQALTSDGQKVDLDITIRYALIKSELPALHQEVGAKFVQRIIRPQSRGVVRMVCSQHPVQDFTSQAREEIRGKIAESLKQSFATAHIDLEEVIIGDVKFSSDFQRAVEEKEQALQAAQQMIYAIQETEGEAQRVVTEAQGDAAAIEARGEALKTNPLLIQYEYIGKIAPNVGGLIVTPENVDKITTPGESSLPPMPELRTKISDLSELGAATPEELAAQLEAELAAELALDEDDVADLTAEIDPEEAAPGEPLTEEAVGTPSDEGVSTDEGTGSAPESAPTEEVE